MFNYEVAINYWEVFLLILVRVASFIYTAPFFGLGGVPQRTKLGLAFFISAIIYTLVPDRALEYSSVIDFAIIILKESIVGLLLGFVCTVCSRVIAFAGHNIDVNIGFSMASMYDPNQKEQVSVTGNLYYYTVFLLMMVSGLYQFLVSAIVDSYTIISINSVTVNLTLYDSFLKVIADYLIIGFRISLPVFVAIMLTNAILGVLTKVAAQLNMFAIGIQIKVLVGLLVMVLTVSLLPVISNFIMEMMKNAVKGIAGGLV